MDCAVSDLIAEFDRFIAAHPDIERFDGFAFDLNGMERGKRFSRGAARSVFAAGTQMPWSNFLLDASGAVTDAGGHGYSDGDPDGLAHVIPGSLRIVPWAQRPTAQFELGLARAGDPGPELDPRQLLLRAASRLAARQLRAVSAFEIEFYLFRPRLDRDGRPMAPRGMSSGRREDNPQVYSMELLADFDPLIDDIMEAAMQQGLPLTVASTEYGRGQFEANLRHVDDPLRAAGECLLTRRLIRGVAARHGLRASFMAKPSLSDAGNGMHVNLSLLDSAGRNVFHAEDGPSLTMRHAIGGLLAALPESLAILAPNRNAFRRFVPGQFVPVTANWGIANRSVAVRAILGDAGSQRIEHRVASSDANPCLALAAILIAAVHGIEHRIEPGPPATGNAGRTADPELPLRIDRALEKLRDAPILAEVLGDWLPLYQEVKRTELARLRNEIPPREYRWYL